MTTEIRNHDIRGYRQGCRCTQCKAGNSEYQRAYYQRRKAAAAEALLKAEKAFPTCKVCGNPDGRDHTHSYCIPAEGAR